MLHLIAQAAPGVTGHDGTLIGLVSAAVVGLLAIVGYLIRITLPTVVTTLLTGFLTEATKQREDDAAQREKDRTAHAAQLTEAHQTFRTAVATIDARSEKVAGEWRNTLLNIMHGKAQDLRPPRGNHPMKRHPFTAAAAAVLLPLLLTVAVMLAAATPATRPAAAARPAAAVATPATSPAVDRLTYTRADGGVYRLRPTDPTFAPVNLELTGARVARAGDRFGEWTVESYTPAAPAAGVVVPAGGDVTAALAAAPPGSTVYLVRGEVYPPIGDARYRPHNVTLTSWGDPAKPAPRVRSTSGRSGLYLWAVDGFTVADVAFEGAGDGLEDGAGLDLWGVRNFTARGLEVTRHRNGVSINPASGRRPADVTFAACWIHDNSPQRDGRHGQGLYAAETDRLTLTGCTFDRNGWSDTYAGTSFNHNVYVQALSGPPTITGCTFSRASSHGLQARSGGTVAECRFVDNPIHLSWALVNGDGPIHPGGCTGVVNRNTFTGTRPVAGQPRGWALEVGDNVVELAVTGNLFDFGSPAFAFGRGAAAAAIKLDVGKPTPGNPDTSTPVGVRVLTIADNLVSWPSVDPTGKAVGAVWIHPTIAARLALRDGRSRVVTQTVFPPAR